MGIDEGEEVQATGMRNKLNNRENFPNLEKEMIIQAQEAFRTSNRQNQNRTSPHHIIIKILSIQNKGRKLKAASKKCQVTYKGKPIRITADFSTETKSKGAWNGISQALST
jgi:hypothetical protein